MMGRVLGLLSAGLAFLGLTGLGGAGCKKERAPQPLTRPPRQPSGNKISTFQPQEPPPATNAPDPVRASDWTDVRFGPNGPNLAEASSRGQLEFVPPPAVTVRTIFEMGRRLKGAHPRDHTTCYVIHMPFARPALLAPTQVALQLTMLEQVRQQGALSAGVFARILRGLAVLVGELSDADCRACGVNRLDLEQRLLRLGAFDPRAAGR